MGGVRLRRAVGVLGANVLVSVLVLAVWTHIAGANTAVTILQGKSVANVTTVADNNFTSNNSTTFINIANAAATVTVPKGESIALVRFNAVTQCTSSTGVHGTCRLRVLIDGTQALPGDIPVASDTDAGAETHGIEVSTGALAVGPHTVQVQARVSSSIMTFTVDDWHMTVMRIKA
jgi:hypothetical protein